MGAASGSVKVTVWDIETSKARKTFDCSSNVLAIAVSPFLGLVAAGEAHAQKLMTARDTLVTSSY